MMGRKDIKDMIITAALCATMLAGATIIAGSIDNVYCDSPSKIDVTIEDWPL